MDNFLNIAWEYIYFFIQKAVALLDFLLEHLHFLGPIPVIFLLAAATVTITRVLKRYIKTKRLVILEKEFQHWLEVREEAMQCKDRERGKALAKNIDTAHLNQAYYDYFLEGLLLGFITFYLPVISMATYINKAYESERLSALFGKSYLLKFGDNDPVLIGALFCFIVFVVFIISSTFIIKWITRRYRTARKNCLPDHPEKNGAEGIESLSKSAIKSKNSTSNFSIRIEESTI